MLTPGAPAIDFHGRRGAALLTPATSTAVMRWPPPCLTAWTSPWRPRAPPCPAARTSSGKIRATPSRAGLRCLIVDSVLSHAAARLLSSIMASSPERDAPQCPLRVLGGGPDHRQRPGFRRSCVAEALRAAPLCRPLLCLAGAGARALYLASASPLTLRTSFRLCAYDPQPTVTGTRARPHFLVPPAQGLATGLASLGRRGFID